MTYCLKYEDNNEVRGGEGWIKKNLPTSWMNFDEFC